MTTLLTVERVGRVAPFGVRFVDDQSGRIVGDGLRVVAWPSSEPSRARALTLNGSNVYYLADAPGLRDVSWGAGDDAYWSGLGRRLDYTVEVTDLAGRFLPFRFSATLPLRGLMRLACGSPATPAPLPDGAADDGVPLFTAPTRPRTPGTVVVRAELWDAFAQAPAAWAILEALTPGAAARGESPRRALADDRGCVALHFPIPDERDFDGGSFDSPIGSGGTPLGARTWSVNLSAAYGALAPPPGSNSRTPPPLTDLCAGLGQPPAQLWQQLGSAPLELTSVTLHVGQDSFLRSSDPTAPPSVVLLTRSTSPP